MSILEQVVAAVTPGHEADGPDAVDLLKKDHDEVDQLLKDYEMLAEGESDAADRRDLSTRICGLLAVHAMIEEEIFYPAARQAQVDATLLNEAQVEHATAKHMIAEIGKSQASDPLYDAKVKVLGEYIRHHVEEEERDMFPKCRAAKMDLSEIGARLEKRKAALLKKLHGG